MSGLAEGGTQPALTSFAADGTAVHRSRAQLGREATQLAGALQAQGVVRGEAVLLLGPSGAHWVLACLGLLRAGAVVVPVDVQTTPAVLAHILRDSGACRVITTPELYSDTARAPVLAGITPLWMGEVHDPLRGCAALAAQADPAPLLNIDPQDLAVLFYTSGTTGMPKGVPLTHANLCFQIAALRATGLIHPGDRVLLPLPLHHVYPFAIGLLGALGLGLTVLFPAGLGGPEIRHAMHAGRATVLVGVPRLYRALVDGIEGRLAAARAPVRGVLAGAQRLSLAARARGLMWPGRVLLAPLRKAIAPTLRLLACGGAPLDGAVHQRLLALGFEIGVGYGLTETAPLLTLSDGRCPPGSVGHPLAGVELRLGRAAVPENLPPGVAPESTGEVQARGGGVFGGYRNLTQANREVFTDDGWFRTGDLGYHDARGCLHLLGRGATLVITESGKKFDPEGVEAHYQQHPGIVEIGVLAYEGRVAAVVVPAPGLDEPAVRAALRTAGAGLPSYQQIEALVLSAQPLPRTQLGKLRRHELAALYPALRAGQVPEAGAVALPEALVHDPRAAAALAVLELRFPGQRLAPDTQMRMDLGVDSIGWVGLTLDLEARGVFLPESALADVHTVGDFLAAASTHGAASGASVQAPDAHSTALLGPVAAWQQPLRMLLYGLAAALMRGYFGLRVQRSAPLPEGAVLVLPNHGSYLDAPALGVALGWRALGRTCWAGWVGITHVNAVMRLLSRLARILPVDPERRPAASLAAAQAALDQGNVLVWFPEGQRSLDGALGPLRPGIGLLLARQPVTVLPVWIEGAHAALPPGRRWPRRVPIRVRFGTPRRLEAGTPDALGAAVSAAIEATRDQG